MSNNTEIEKIIKKTIDQEIENQVKEAVELAKQELDKKIPEIVASVSVDVFKVFDAENLKDRLIININKN